jgi:hypothetical protein
LSCAKLLLFAVALEMARGAAWATAAFVGICATSVLDFADAAHRVSFLSSWR